MNNKEPKIQVITSAGTETLRIVSEPVKERRVHEWNSRGYKLESMQAVIDLVDRKGSKENTVVFYNEKSVRVILDDSIQDRPLDIATYNFDISYQFAQWHSIFGSRLTQKQFIDYLKRLDTSELSDRDLLIANVRKLQVITEIKGDYEYDDAGNISVMYKENNGKEGLMALPRLITPHLPLLKESDYETLIEIELELIKPKSEDQKPTIVLTCPKMDIYLQDAIMYEVGILKEKLPDILILAGQW